MTCSTTGTLLLVQLIKSSCKQATAELYILTPDAVPFCRLPTGSTSGVSVYNLNSKKCPCAYSMRFTLTDEQDDRAALRSREVAE